MSEDEREGNGSVAAPTVAELEARFRDPDESLTEWRDRLRFVQHFHGRFDDDRLNCLSHCYVCVKTYGCSYPALLMRQLATLIRELPKHTDDDVSPTKIARHRMATSFQQGFVKSCDALQSSQTTFATPTQAPYIAASSTKDDESEEIMQYYTSGAPKQTVQQVGGARRAALVTLTQRSGDCSPKTPDVAATTRGQLVERLRAAHWLAKFFGCCIDWLGYQGQTDALRHALAVATGDAGGVACASTLLPALDSVDVISALHLAGQKLQLVVNSCSRVAASGQPTCFFTVANCPGPLATSSSKKRAKQLAAQKMLHMIADAVALTTASSTSTIITSALPSERVGSEAAVFDLDEAALRRLLPADFLILTDAGSSGSFGTLLRSAQFCKVALQLTAVDGGLYQVAMNRVVVAVLRADTAVPDARLQAAASRHVLDRLQRLYWTVEAESKSLHITDMVDSGRCVSKDSVDTQRDALIGADMSMTPGEAANGGEEISSDNVGHRLLKMMGWSSGKGLGKSEQGIKEPVQTQTTINRRGFGLTELASGDADAPVSDDFRRRVRKYLRDYINTDELDERVLSPDFSRSERAVFHKEAQKLGLMTRSYNCKQGRCLTLKKRLTPGMFLNHLRTSPAASRRYRLIPPSSA